MTCAATAVQCPMRRLSNAQASCSSRTAPSTRSQHFGRLDVNASASVCRSQRQRLQPRNCRCASYACAATASSQRDPAEVSLLSSKLYQNACFITDIRAASRICASVLAAHAHSLHVMMPQGAPAGGADGDEVILSKEDDWVVSLVHLRLGACTCSRSVLTQRSPVERFILLHPPHRCRGVRTTLCRATRSSGELCRTHARSSKRLVAW